LARAIAAQTHRDTKAMARAKSQRAPITKLTNLVALLRQSLPTAIQAEYKI